MTISKSALRPIAAVAADLGLTEDDYDAHGRHRAKIHLDVPRDEQGRGRYVLVTATTPTAAGIGKTVTSIGLAMGLSRLGHRAAVTLRESAMGPTFGGKGGGAGGGAARIVPLDECLLGLGDGAAVEGATNLLAAVVDDVLHRHGSLDPDSISWRRVLDVDDRSLRRVLVGLGGRTNGPPRETGFDITAASEVMALLTLSRDLRDLRARLDAVVPAWDVEGKPVTAGQLQAAGAMAVLLREALQPNLLQTSEGTPALIHAGPFGNLSVGCSSVVADRLALPRTEFLVTEAGFGADLGAEKFFHLKCRASGEFPNAAVLVTTVGSMREQGGASLTTPDVAAVGIGTANLIRHLQMLQAFGVPVVVAINSFPGDTSDEIAAIRAAAQEHGVVATTHTAFAHGGEGALELADAVVTACEGSPTRPEARELYHLSDSCQDKVTALATQVYGAAAVAWEPAAVRALDRIVDAGYGHLPVCMAKTHLSFSHDPKLRGAPRGFTLPVREVHLAAGAGYLSLLTGDIMTMPGLPASPRLLGMDLDAQGRVTGLT
jgi:formate--tetrahydrofolate ligase